MVTIIGDNMNGALAPKPKSEGPAVRDLVNAALAAGLLTEAQASQLTSAVKEIGLAGVLEAVRAAADKKAPKLKTPTHKATVKPTATTTGEDALAIVDAAEKAGDITTVKAIELRGKAAVLGAEGVRLVLSALADRRREQLAAGKNFRSSALDDDTPFEASKASKAAKAKPNNGNLTERELAACKAKGVDPAAYAAKRDELASRTVRSGGGK